MKHLVSIAFGMDSSHFDRTIDFEGQTYRVSEYSTNFDMELTKGLVKKFDGACDAICISGLPNRIDLSKGESFIHPQTATLKSLAYETPIFTGQDLKDIFIPYILRRECRARPRFFNSKAFSIYAGGVNFREASVLEEMNFDITLADPYFFFRIPRFLKTTKAVKRIIKLMAPILKRKTIRRSRVSLFQKDNPVLAPFFKGDVFVGNEASFNYIDLSHLNRKSIIVDMLTPSLKKRLVDVGVHEVLSIMSEDLVSKGLSYTILEGLIFLSKNKADLEQKDLIKWIESSSPKGHLHELMNVNSNDRQSIEKFAFIIHPLSGDYLFKHPLLKFLPQNKLVKDTAEEIMGHAPGFYYGKIPGIRSIKSGKTVDGLIYAVTETPKKLMSKDPEKVYKKLIRLSELAKNQGAKIIGLGAYTKIVGDAGVSVNKRSPIPVTTGNSLSACSTLWAAKYAVDKMNLVKKEDGRYLGKAVVIGATGSIGAVCSKFLADTWSEVTIMAPRAYKLIELKEEITKEFPNSKVSVSTKADEAILNADLIITSTSGMGKKILDIKRVKPGAIICDVSRPFDITEKEAMSRPDVMVVASGEVLLPGVNEIKIDLGLEGAMVYACLAETALLALEGRYEPFTLSRRIDYHKVVEIDRMAKDHGVKLATIMGHNGIITEEEFNLCRRHALTKE